MKISHDDSFLSFSYHEQRAQRVVGTTLSQAPLMIHYTCDRCKRQINIADQTRYVVQIDIQSALEQPREDVEDDIDQLAELHQMLEGINDAQFEEEDCESPESSHHGRYDLCPECHRQFLKNPLGRDAVLALGFSNN